MAGLYKIASPENFDFVSQFNRIADLDAHVTMGTLDLRVTKQRLDRANILGAPVGETGLVLRSEPIPN